MPETATGGVLWKKVFFNISQNSQETPVPEGWANLRFNLFVSGVNHVE